MVAVPAHAKINLALRVHERLPNGYHRIETVMAKIDLADEVTVETKPASFGVRASVPGHPELETDSNLAVRAARAYLERANRSDGVSIRIQKKIPVGGGLGGGSADAAAVLRALSELVPGLAEADLSALAIGLGADVPFLLHPARLAFAGGVGEELTPWPSLPPRAVVLVNPGFPVSTPEAYRSLGRTLTWTHPDGSSFAPRKRPEKWSDLDWLFRIGNDLQETVERRFPAVTGVRTELVRAGASFAQMSGSGSTVFGFFGDEAAARAAVRCLGEKYRAFLAHTL